MFEFLGVWESWASKVEWITETIVKFSSPQASCQRIRNGVRGFPGGAVVENLPANAGDTGSSPGLGRSHMPRSN